MSAPGRVAHERRGAVAWITFDRPDARNAMTFAMYDELHDACRALAADATVRAVVLTGAGTQAFVAGTDIAEFRAFSQPADAIAYERHMDEVLRALEDLRVPTIAAIRGACTGGGASIASVCDLRVVTPGARIGYPIARTLGNCLSLHNYARMTALVGEAALKRMVYTAELIDGRRAYELGFATDLVAADEALDAAVASLAEQIAGNAPLTLAVTKEALRRLRHDGPDADDTDLIRTCYESNDFREGIAAFFEKRPAAWSGR